MKRINIAKIIYFCVVILIYLVATIGYLYAGENWFDATYFAVQLFVLGGSQINNPNILVYVSRIICPIVSATGLFVLLRNTFKIVSDSIVSGMRNATAIYYDTNQIRGIGNRFCHPIMNGNRVNKRVKSHVLLFERDVDNLKFYEQIKEDIKKGSKVYIKLEEIESKLLKDSDVYYFNVNEIIARTYWQDRTLQTHYVNGGLTVKIAIIGFDILGQNILDYGLMNNIYSLNQSIHYHIWGESLLYQNLLGDFDKMNGDTITYHAVDWREDIDQFKEFDRIIVIQENNLEILQALMYLSSNAEIDFYNPTGEKITDIYMNGKLNGFGAWKDVVTEDNIKTDKLYRAAKKTNYNYTVKYDVTEAYTWTRSDVEEVMEKKWNELSGFLKGSNIASADYHVIRLLVMEAFGMDKESLSVEQEMILAEMEHVRWCRYHYVNHWHYNDMRDNSKRQHHLLIPYEKLSDEEKRKDIDNVYEMFVER